MKNTISTPLAKFFNTSLDTGKLPLEWKCANITAIYKKGGKEILGSYRPISLTSIVGKVMESIIRDMIINYMKSNKLYSARQYGFISGRFTVLQLLTVMEKWYKTLDKGGCIDVIYCDFMKAFDKVPHRRLLKIWDIRGHLGVGNIISKQQKTESESKLRPSGWML